MTSVTGQFLQRPSTGGRHRRWKWRKIEARRPEALPLEIDHHTASMGRWRLQSAAKSMKLGPGVIVQARYESQLGFFDRSVDAQILKRGMDAHNHPNFYRQLRQDPDQITADALQLLARKFNLSS